MTSTEHDGMHDPNEQATVPTDETPDERAARLNEPAEQEQEDEQQKRAEKRAEKKKAESQ